MYTAKDRPKAVSLLNAIAVQGSGIETVQGAREGATTQVGSGGRVMSGGRPAA
jgi:hypothetical protein